jgi:hypothetical protein
MAEPAEMSAVPPLILCPKCQREMRLFGIEPETAARDLLTFECRNCALLEVRGVSTV